MKTFFIFFIFAMLSGCVIPTPEHRLSGRVPLDEKKCTFLQPGVTERAEVVLKFGEPDLVIKKEKIFVYQWDLTQAYLLIGGYGRGEIIPLSNTYFLLLEFDDDNKLKRYETKKHGIFSSRIPFVELFEHW